MTKDEALRLALEALEKISRTQYHIETPPIESLEEKMRRIADKAITAIEAAREQPQEKYTYGTPLLDAMVGCPPCNNHCNQGRTCPSRQTRETATPVLYKEFDTAYDEYKTELRRQRIIENMRQPTSETLNKIKKEAQDIKRIRNQTLEEVATRFDYMTAFGDTAASFARYVRNLKDE
jgi:hypothetical protein